MFSLAFWNSSQAWVSLGMSCSVEDLISAMLATYGCKVDEL